LQKNKQDKDNNAIKRKLPDIKMTAVATMNGKFCRRVKRPRATDFRGDCTFYVGLLPL